MDNSLSSKDIWDLAAKAGLALGGVSIAYMAVTQFCMPSSSKVGMSMLISVLSLALWGAKFFGCIWLMKYFMKSLVSQHSDATNGDTFKLGVFTALLSSLLYSGFYLLYTTVLAPDTFTDAVAMVQEAYSGMLPQESIDAMGEINLPQLSFFTNFIYCFLFGTVLSAIVSRNIPSKNPFAEFRDQDTDRK